MNQTYFVFEEYHTFDGGGMHIKECEGDHELRKHLNSLVAGKSEDDANEILNSLWIIQGDRVTPQIKSVVKEVVVEL